VGLNGTPVALAPNASQTFVFAITPNQALPPTDVQLAFACGGTQAPITVGLNTLLLSASITPVPDIVALVATLHNDGTVDLPGPTGAGVFSVATSNAGAAATITASADTGAAGLPLSISLCATDPNTGVCVAAPTSSVTVAIGAGAKSSFGVFVTGRGVI